MPPVPQAGILGGLIRRFFGSAISTAAGYGMGSAIAPTLEPLTRDLANTTWRAHPVMPLSAAAAASAMLRGFLSPEAAYVQASHTGFETTQVDVLARLAGDAPPVGQLLELRRRGIIDAAQLTEGLRQNGVLAEWRGPVRLLLDVLPSVTDLVHMAVREVFNPGLRSSLDLDAELPGAFVQRAAALGISPELASDYWADHWQLPSFTQLAQMLFRTDLGAQGFSDSLKALDYAPTWRDKLETIARPIPPLSDMIRFAVRDVYTPSTVSRFGLNDDFPAVFAQQAALHGMESPYPQQYWAAHWRLPSALQGFRMLWRKIIEPADLDVLLKALDYPPFWRDRLVQLAHIVPGRIDLKRMLRHDILTPAQVEAGYARLGYSALDADRMTQIAVAELAAGDVAQTWATRARGRLYTVTHNEYLDGSIDAAAARAMLGRVGAASAEQGLVIALWDAEQTINRLELTPAQIKKAWKAGEYDDAQATAELVERQMTSEDAGIFLRS